MLVVNVPGGSLFADRGPQMLHIRRANRPYVNLKLRLGFTLTPLQEQYMLNFLCFATPTTTYGTSIKKIITKIRVRCQNIHDEGLRSNRVFYRPHRQITRNNRILVDLTHVDNGNFVNSATRRTNLVTRTTRLLLYDKRVRRTKLGHAGSTIDLSFNGINNLFYN